MIDLDENENNMQIYIVLTGYYYKYFDLYQKIVEEIRLYSGIRFKLYILSHKLKKEISDDFYNYLITNNWHIIYRANAGWDWGCHVQFMQWLNEKHILKPDYILFLHDDIKIIKNGFIQKFLTKAKKGYELIGNSKPFTTINSYEQDYSDEAFILQNNGFEFEPGKIEIVRGSAFFTTYNLAEQALNNLPYQKCGSINLANRSLRMFGAIVTKMVGTDKIGYLSDKHFRSDFITEEMRGGNISSFFFSKRSLFSKIRKVLNYVDEKLISIHLLKHAFTSNEKSSLKVNIAHDKYLPGYLNISINKSICSDITFETLDYLFTQGKIIRVLTSFEIANENNLFSDIILKRIIKSKGPVDLLIDADNASKYAVSGFLQKYETLKIKIERIPRRKGTRWIKRLYIKYPQENLGPN